MKIHSGKKYTVAVRCDRGNMLAVKTADDGSERTMTYYPERDTSAIAGELDEAGAWRLLADIEPGDTPVSPSHIFIDGDGFVLSPWSASHDPRFTAPEGYEPVWALGATVFYLVLGTHVFGSRGGKGQSATSPVPVMRASCADLSKLVARCLSFNPSERPTLSEIKEIATDNLRRIAALPPVARPLKSAPVSLTPDSLSELWPEEIY